MTPLVMLWLGVCSWQDWKRRQVSNWLTLPPLALALGLRLLGMSNGPLLLLALILAAALVAWRGGWMGGADTKVMAALVLADVRLALWAWVGATLWYGLLFAYGRFIAKDRDRIRLPGMLGFLLGAGAYWLWL